MMKQYIKSLTALVMSEHPNLGPGDDLLSLLYEAYTECNNTDTAQIKSAYRSLYQAMNSKTLEEMDTILYPVCAICREHELSGFITGIKLALRLIRELK